MARAQGNDPLRIAIQEYRDEDEDWSELTPVLTEAITKGMASRPDTNPPLSGFAVAWGTAKLGANGRVAWLVALLVALVAALYVVATHR